MEYGDKVYNTINNILSSGDSLRSIFGGRYIIEYDEPTRTCYISKKYFLGRDRPLSKKDFLGFIGDNNNRFLRKIEKHIKRYGIPKNIRILIKDDYAMRAAENLFRRRDLADYPIEEQEGILKKEGNEYRWALPLCLGAGLLAFWARDTGPTNPPEIETFKEALRYLATAVGSVGLFETLESVVASLNHVNLNRYRHLRKVLKDIKLGFDI